MYPVLVYFFEVVRQRKTIDSVIRKQKADAMTKGTRTFRCRAKPASIVAARIQSCATLIKTNMITRACQTAL
jgi:hypothetical protein